VLRKKSRGSDPDNSYISYIVLCDGRYLGRIFYTDAGVPKDAAGFGVSNFTSGKDARPNRGGNAFKATWESR